MCLGTTDFFNLDFVWEQLINIQLDNAVILLVTHDHVIRQLSNHLDINL